MVVLIKTAIFYFPSWLVYRRKQHAVFGEACTHRLARNTNCGINYYPYIKTLSLPGSALPDHQSQVF